MGICVTLQADGTLAPTGEAVESCTGYVLVTGSEQAALTTNVESLAAVFEWPTPEVLSSWVVAAFGFVLVMNVVGYITGAVVKMLSTERD